MTKAKLLEILDKHVDEKGLMKDLSIQIFIPYLEEFVKDTANPYDDSLVKWFKEFIEKN
jgi:hypothetical protein